MSQHDAIDFDAYFDEDKTPWSQEAEQSVLGALLVDNAAWDVVGDVLTAAQFYDVRNGAIFDAIGQMIVNCKAADVLTVFAALQTAGKSVECGGIAYLHSLAAFVMSASNARHYAEIVAERALMRALLGAADSIRALAVEPGVSVADKLDQSQSLLQSVQTHQGRSMPEHVEGAMIRMISRLQDVADGKCTPGMRTRIPRLDDMLGGGLQGGKQIILAARPSVGKSSFAAQLLLNIARDGYPVAILSQEMTKAELTDRLVSNVGQIDLGRISSGRLDDGDWRALTDGVEALRALPIYLDDQPALTLHDISAKARALVRQHGVRVLAIDYIQLCSGAKDGDNRHHQIESLSRGLKALAKQLDMAIITLSQLNREVEKRSSGGRPQLSDLKESGAIEEDADIVMMLWRGAAATDGMQVINCDVPKNRQGRVGSVALGFVGCYQTWHETIAPVEFKTPARRHYTEEV